MSIETPQSSPESLTKNPEYSFIDIKSFRTMNAKKLGSEHQKIMNIPVGMITDADKKVLLERYKTIFDGVLSKWGMHISFESELDTLVNTGLIKPEEGVKMKAELGKALIAYAQDSGVRKFEARLQRNEEGAIYLSPDRTLMQTDTPFTVNLAGTPRRSDIAMSLALETPIWNEGRREVMLARAEEVQKVRESARSSQLATRIPVMPGQKIILTLPQAAELKELIAGCDLSTSCMKSNTVDIRKLQEEVKEYFGFEKVDKKYANGAKWVDGICGPDTLAACRMYAAAHVAISKTTPPIEDEITLETPPIDEAALYRPYA
jgi:hypothetical protein